MKTLFGLSGLAVVATGILVVATGTVHAQYLPPVINNAFSSGSAPDFVYPEKKQELKPIRENQDTRLIYRQYEDELRVPAFGPVVQEQYRIVIMPVADQSAQAAPPQVQPPKVIPLPSPVDAPQPMPGMVAQTIYYFPPPTFPNPIPLTVYRPAEPQQPQAEQYPPQAPGAEGGYPQGWSPYGPMPQYPNPMYAPPMITQKQYFGPPKQPSQSFCDDCGSGSKGRRFFKSKSKDPGQPGEPVVGPPTLVYPNGIVVRPKVYLPGQPFKNTVRAMTP